MRRLVPTGAALVALACSGCATGLTGPAPLIAHDGAVVVATVVSDTGGDVQVWAEFGLTRAYGSQTPRRTIAAEPNTLTSTELGVFGLQRSTLYHYRVCAEDSEQQGGPGCGEDRTFRTQRFGCGETVTADMRLTGDLNCEGFGTSLAIGAPGIVIDLAGHVVFGAGTGIDNSAGHDDVVVRDGSLSASISGILLEGASRNRFLDLDVGTRGTAILITGGEANEIRRAGLAGESGLAAMGSDHLVVTDTGVDNVTGIAIRVFGDRARLRRNRTPTFGGPFAFPSGIQVAGNDNLVRDNLVEGPWKEAGIALLSGSNNSILENEVSGGAADGIFVGAFTAGTRLRDNFAHGNGDDGIEVAAPASRLRGNRADDNGDFGIDAVAGVIDLGGNSASGNGNPLQCRNVFCQ
jgi:parallel beta-helix repeat protein